MKKLNKKAATKKAVKKTKVRKVRANEVNKVATANTNKVVLTLKQAQAIQTLLTKVGKTNKTLNNKIAAVVA